MIIESIRNNIRSVELRRSLIGLGKTSIRELRKFSVKWENVSEMISEEVCYKVDVRELGTSKVNTLEDRLRNLEISNRGAEGKYRELESRMSIRSRGELVCFKCGNKGHIEIWCRSSLKLECSALSRAGVHHIRTIDDVPVNSGYRRIPPGQLQQVKEHLDGLLKDGVIEPSESNYCSHMVIVKKKSGDIRLCIDYRKLNTKTIRDTYPLIRVDDLLDIVAGKKYYTSSDLNQLITRYKWLVRTNIKRHLFHH